MRRRWCAGSGQADAHPSGRMLHASEFRVAVTEPDNSPSADQIEPRGTLAIVAVFGALVVVGWLLLFFGLFVPRGTH
jgi:hypothetical protein